MAGHLKQAAVERRLHVDIFVDDGNRPYLYFPGRSMSHVAPLNPDDLTRFAAAPKHLFGFQPSHVWER